MLRAVCRRLCAAAIVLLLAISACGGPHPRLARSGLNTMSALAGPSAMSSSALPTAVVSTGTSQLPLAVETSRRLSSTTATPQLTGRATSSISAGCGVGRAAGTTVLVLPGGRRALLAVPGGDTGRRRLGLVIGLPGYGQTPEQFAAQSRLPARAMAAGVLAVLPQGAGPARSWNFSGTTGYDDRAFLSTLITRLVTTECADAARIVITGISDGGVMAAFAACSLHVSFRAVVTVAASTEPRLGCRPMRMIAVHGDADPLDPYSGGPDGRRGYPAAPAAIPAIAAWAATRRLRARDYQFDRPAHCHDHVRVRRPTRDGQRRRSHVARRRSGCRGARIDNGRIRRHGHDPRAHLNCQPQTHVPCHRLAQRFPGSLGRHSFVRPDQHRSFMRSTIRPGDPACLSAWSISTTTIGDASC